MNVTCPHCGSEADVTITGDETYRLSAQTTGCRYLQEKSQSTNSAIGDCPYLEEAVLDAAQQLRRSRE